MIIKINIKIYTKNLIKIYNFVRSWQEIRIFY